jgi:hypothetical protein
MAKLAQIALCREDGDNPLTALTGQEEDFCDVLNELLSFPIGYFFTRHPVDVLDEARGRLHVGYCSPNSDLSGEPAVSFYVSRDSVTGRYELRNAYGNGGVFQELGDLVAWFSALPLPKEG